jgi:DNA ligase-1
LVFPRLLKYKIAEDAEYTIVNVLEGKGKELGCAIFECQAGEKTFTVRPIGTEEYRKQLWADRDKLIGLPLTVKYNGLTDEGLPRFPVGKEVRIYE